ncbi:DUF3141 domain-containing protein [Pistricoccus aurantiacus]|uniref:DUF3141 domain-containing protein n=1 Tax=Pistricoccus aurantiacus TaxID=1883414 RepID=UPI00362F6FD0
MLQAFTSPIDAMLSWCDPFGVGRAALDYWRDSVERRVLYLDVMRQRGNQYLEHMRLEKPNVLGFEAETIMDGLDLPRPVNYELMWIEPPQGVETDWQKRPFVVVDPRAGHGPGIGGFKPDSEIGVALRAGHPCYFIGFLPFPEPGQTVEDVVDAEIAFLKEVINRHPQVSEKPIVVANCQAGWQIMMAAALEPECFGPLLIAGAPLSYWAGERGKAPMRYSAGMMGGSWLASLASDLGAGNFDGAWLVQNFEKLNPANTLWGKQYNLYSNIDTEASRYLQFERWWGGHVMLGAQEIQYIVDKLFVGNRLSTSRIITQDGRRIDLRNIRSPIVVFCSQGDDITPPPQALGWVRDLYENTDEILAQEQTIVYCVHDRTGHLGIFVSGSISRKEHTEFTENMDYIDVLPPGLFEAKVTETAARGAAEAEHIEGDYLLEFMPRTIEDVNEIVQPNEEDERRFATVARLSNINRGIYEVTLQPWLQAIISNSAARIMRRCHPIRFGYRLYSDLNPLTAPLPVMAEAIRKDRHQVAEHNPWKVAEGIASHQIEQSLDAFREVRDRMVEKLFLQIYGQTWLQTMVGLGTHDGLEFRRRPGSELEHRRFVANRKTELCSRIDQGSGLEAMMRALIYVLGGAPTTDERNFNRLTASWEEFEEDIDLATFKKMLRDQFLILKLDRQGALDGLSVLLADQSDDQIDHYLETIEHVVNVSGQMTPRSEERLEAVKAKFAQARSVNSPTGGEKPVKLDEVKSSDSTDPSAPRKPRAQQKARTAKRRK